MDFLSFIFVLSTLLLSSSQIHARESNFFTTTINNNGDIEPKFMPENENEYGVHGHHESGPVAYVTVPQETNFMNSEFTIHDDNGNNYRSRTVGSRATDFIEPSDGGDYHYNNKDELRNSSERRLMEKGYATTNSTDNSGKAERVQQQGTNDTESSQLDDMGHETFRTYRGNVVDNPAEEPSSMP
ncbi:protein E6-like [Lycium ferocissimum]|uniref:protein E6-like n=1 Tax=Lycium ferocissimum TaxID=112874 RepID=UPI002814B492|nr:protein E6-like [Lycium ferocissimum]